MKGGLIFVIVVLITLLVIGGIYINNLFSEVEEDSSENKEIKYPEDTVFPPTGGTINPPDTIPDTINSSE